MTEESWLEELKVQREQESASQRLRERRIDEYVAKVVAEAPPLSPAQLDRIALLLLDGGAR